MKYRKVRHSELYTSKHYPNLICPEVYWKIILKSVECSGRQGFNWLKILFEIHQRAVASEFAKDPDFTCRLIVTFRGGGMIYVAKRELLVLMVR
jgi:hypothetical protein